MATLSREQYKEKQQDRKTKALPNANRVTSSHTDRQLQLYQMFLYIEMSVAYQTAHAWLRETEITASAEKNFHWWSKGDISFLSGCCFFPVLWSVILFCEVVLEALPHARHEWSSTMLQDSLVLCNLTSWQTAVGSKKNLNRPVRNWWWQTNVFSQTQNLRYHFLIFL